MDPESNQRLIASTQAVETRRSCGLYAAVALSWIVAFVALIIAAVALSIGQASNAAMPTCDVSGYYKCVGGSFCVGTTGAAAATDAYFTSASNGIEFDRWEYLPTGAGSAPSGQFVRMEIHGGCASKPCGFHENELYTPVPGTLLNWEGFTVNRTGAADGQQVFYENVYFTSPTCDSYVKIVKGQQVALAPSGVLCHNECTRTTKEDYEAGIQGGYQQVE